MIVFRILLTALGYRIVVTFLPPLSLLWPCLKLYFIFLEPCLFSLFSPWPPALLSGLVPFLVSENPVSSFPSSYEICLLLLWTRWQEALFSFAPGCAPRFVPVRGCLFIPSRPTLAIKDNGRRSFDSAVVRSMGFLLLRGVISLSRSFPRFVDVLPRLLIFLRRLLSVPLFSFPRLLRMYLLHSPIRGRRSPIRSRVLCQRLWFFFSSSWQAGRTSPS